MTNKRIVFPFSDRVIRFHDLNIWNDVTEWSRDFLVLLCWQPNGHNVSHQGNKRNQVKLEKRINESTKGNNYFNIRLRYLIFLLYLIIFCTDEHWHTSELSSIKFRPSNIKHLFLHFITIYILFNYVKLIFSYISSKLNILILGCHFCFTLRQRKIAKVNLQIWNGNCVLFISKIWRFRAVTDVVKSQNQNNLRCDLIFGRDSATIIKTVWIHSVHQKQQNLCVCVKVCR